MLEKVKTTIDYQMTIEDAIEFNTMLESRTPRNGVYVDFSKNNCPICGATIYRYYRFCPICGQRVVFSENDERDYIPFNEIGDEEVLK